MRTASNGSERPLAGGSSELAGRLLCRPRAHRPSRGGALGCPRSPSPPAASRGPGRRRPARRRAPVLLVRGARSGGRRAALPPVIANDLVHQGWRQLAGLPRGIAGPAAALNPRGFASRGLCPGPKRQSLRGPQRGRLCLSPNPHSSPLRRASSANPLPTRAPAATSGFLRSPFKTSSCPAAGETETGNGLLKAGRGGSSAGRPAWRRRSA